MDDCRPHPASAAAARALLGLETGRHASGLASSPPDWRLLLALYAETREGRAPCAAELAFLAAVEPQDCETLLAAFARSGQVVAESPAGPCRLSDEAAARIADWIEAYRLSA